MRRRFHSWFDHLAVDTPGAPPRRWDWILVVVLVLAAIAEWVLLPFPNQMLTAAPAFVAFAVIPVRRQIPLYAALIAHGAVVVVDIATSLVGTEVDLVYAHAVAGLVLIYALCRWATTPRVAIGLALVFAMLLVEARLSGPIEAIDIAFLFPWVVLALFALAMRYRATLAANHDTNIRLAERNALARELHDSVAHHVSAIAVQAQAAQFIAKSNPDAAAKAMGDVEAIANNTIDEMRRMVGILRSDADHARTVAATSLAELAAPHGAPRIVIVGESDLSGLPQSVAAAVYRIAQESVTNATRHSRGVTFVDIDLSTNDTTVELEVINDGVPTTRNAGGGYGLVGMNERVEALGGTITTEPRPASGWRVHAEIPVRMKP